MSITDQDAMDAAMALREYCNSFNDKNAKDVCEGCIFDRKGCAMSEPGYLPEAWELEGKE